MNQTYPYSHNSAWRVVTLPESGTYIKAQEGPILARIVADPPALAFWDKHHKQEIVISLGTLNAMFDKG